MTKEQWLNQAEAHKARLVTLIATYHPVALVNMAGKKIETGARITAPNAEAACEVVRNNIRRNFEGNPATEFLEALKEKNVNKLMRLLSDAWFGVPESTDCWRIPGFREAVDLMDDTPDD